MSMLPSLFVSHGAPTLAIEPSPARQFLQSLGAQWPTPRAILVVSAHHSARPLAITASEAPPTLHDFGGFDASLHTMRYPAPGSPALAKRVIRILHDAGVHATADAHRGLDHGAWVPLSLAYPKAAVPVVQLSIDARRDARWHLSLGKALAPLRGEGVLILASGGATHNLRALFMPGGLPPVDAPAPRWVSAFADWLADELNGGTPQRIADTWIDAPHALDNHPTAEHLLPLFVALGAGGAPACLHRSTTHGVLAMDAYAFA